VDGINLDHPLVLADRVESYESLGSPRSHAVRYN
jgi:hypothetical protein